MNLVAELKRRNVFKVAAAYIIVGWLIMQAGEVMAPALNLPDWVNSLLAFFLILGFPVAMVFAWAFELTPEGLKKERDVDRSQSITQVTSRRLDFVIIGLLVLALGYFLYDEFVIERREAGEPETASGVADAETGRNTIAVLPLADMSPLGDHEYFSDGLTEELLNILAKIKELQVAGRTSSFAFKGRNEDLREIGRKLNVASILEGSVRKDEARNRVRITLQLINVADGYHLWSETYDRNLDDIFAIQEEVAHEVAGALRVTLLGEDQARLERIATTDIDTYDLYLQGLQEVNKNAYVSLDKAVTLFQQVLAEDPNYLPAKLGLANAWGRMAATGAATSEATLARGLPLLEQILAEQPDNVEALWIYSAYQHGIGNHELAEQSLVRALELSPGNADLLNRYGRFLYNRGEVDRGLALIDTATTIDPYNTDVLFNQCQTHAHQRHFETAVTACRRLQEIEPDGPQGYYGEALAYIYAGDLPRAMLGYLRAIERDPEDYEMLAAMAQFWIALGDSEQALAWQQRAEAIGAGQPIPTNARILLLEFNEQYERAGEMAAQALAAQMDDRHGSNFYFRRAYAMHAVRTGDLQRGLAPFRDLYPWAFAPELVFPPTANEAIDDLLFIACLMKRVDPLASRPEELLTFVEQNLNDYFPAMGKGTVPLRRASVRALRGDSEGAVAQLQEAASLDMFAYWRPQVIDNPVFAGLSGDSVFQDFVDAFESRAARQRDEAQALLELDP